MTEPQLLTVVTLETLRAWGKEEWARWWVEPKPDGARAIFHKGKFYSRTGHEFVNCQHIADELNKFPGWTFDGELVASTWSATMSIIKTKKVKDGTAVVFRVFDCMSDVSWINADCSDTTASRRGQLLSILRKSGIKFVLPIIAKTVSSFTEFECLHLGHLFKGCDGTVLKEASSQYEFRRTKTWLKVKPVLTFDGVVTGADEGKGKYKGMLGALHVVFDGVTTKVSGMDDYHRIAWWRTSSLIVGKTIEVEARGKHDSGCLIEPRFVRIREDK